LVFVSKMQGGSSQPLMPDGVPAQVSMSASAPTGAAARQALAADELMTAQEQSPAYRALHDQNLITSQYRVRSTEDLDLVKSDATITASRVLQVTTCNGCCCFLKTFAVSNGCLRKGRHSNGEYIFFGEGPHSIKSPYITVDSADIPLLSTHIVHGTKAILTVEQGFIGFASDRGQPVLLAPGLHQWTSTTMKFETMIDLSTSVICLGPYTLVTVDEGYAAVTSDNGEQKILDGGQAYMLTHRNWKFEKFMTKKLQTNDIGPIKVTTGDNVPLEVTATVNWVIENVILAARMSANTMQKQAPSATAATPEFDISKLRADVLRQVTASLAAFVGTISYSANGHAELAHQVQGRAKTSGCDAKLCEPEPEEEKGGSGAKALFDVRQIHGSVQHANEICSKYGVNILSMNIISAYPADKVLLTAMSQGAVATVAAEQTETAARGEAAALLAKARAEAEAARIRAEGDARAEEVRAEGSLKAARRLEESDVAVMVTKMRTAGAALGEGKANSFFFGLSGAGDIPSGVLGNALLAKATATSVH